MHVFITGERQIGKSRAIRRISEAMGRPLYGFRTQFLDRERGRSSLYMNAPQGEPILDEAHMVAVLEAGKMRALTEQFDMIGSRLLQEARKHPEGLILMDECGHLEKNARQFQQEILNCLDGSIPVFGVLRKDQAWHDFIWQHPGVQVLTMTEENRNDLDEMIIRLLETK